MIANLMFLCIFLTVCSCELIVSQLTQMKDMHNLRPVGNSSLVISSASVLQCVIECSNSMSCESLSHHSDKGTCLLHPFLFDDTVDKIVEDDWESYGHSCDARRGYIYNKTLDWCYRLFDEENVMPAPEAVELCRSDGARMPRITSLERHVHVVDLLNSLGITSAWIGGYSPNGDNTFIYEDGTPLSYFNWANGEPIGSTYIKLIGYEINIFLWENGIGTFRRNVMCELIY